MTLKIKTIAEFSVQVYTSNNSKKLVFITDTDLLYR